MDCSVAKLNLCPVPCTVQESLHAPIAPSSGLQPLVHLLVMQCRNILTYLSGFPFDRSMNSAQPASFQAQGSKCEVWTEPLQSCRGTGNTILSRACMKATLAGLAIKLQQPKPQPQHFAVQFCLNAATSSQLEHRQAEGMTDHSFSVRSVGHPRQLDESTDTILSDQRFKHGVLRSSQQILSCLRPFLQLTAAQGRCC